MILPAEKSISSGPSQRCQGRLFAQHDLPVSSTSRFGPMQFGQRNSPTTNVRPTWTLPSPFVSPLFAQLRPNFLLQCLLPVRDAPDVLFQRCVRSLRFFVFFILICFFFRKRPIMAQPTKGRSSAVASRRNFGGFGSSSYHFFLLPLYNKNASKSINYTRATNGGVPTKTFFSCRPFVGSIWRKSFQA